MKKFTPAAFLLAFLFIVPPSPTGAFDNKPVPRQLLTAVYVKKELTTHEWTLREIVQTKEDTATNLTLFLLPCEKDNILDYHENGTYQITEGDMLCKPSDDKVKGEGEWEFEESDQTIIDSYNGGRRINKKVLELTPGMLKVEYEGEGNTITTLTYFSEIGQKDEALQDLVEDNSNHIKNIARIPREIMLEARRYVMIGLDDFERGLPLTVDDKDGLMSKILIYPFMDSTDPNVTVNENERHATLMAQAKKSGIDYIVTGNIFKAYSEIGPDGEHKGNVKYSVSVLDVANGEESARKSFEYSRLEKEKKAESDSKMLGVFFNVVGGYRYGYFNYYGYNSWRYRRWNRYYRDYFLAEAANNSYRDLDVAFSSYGGSERNNQYQASMAIMDAISNTSEDLGAFIIENVPITIPVNEVITDSKGRFKNLIIEAGQNIGIKEGEKLKLVRINKRTLSNGNVVSSKTEIAKFVVESVDGTHLSTCKAYGYSSKKQISEAFEAYPEEVFVQTMELKADD